MSLYVRKYGELDLNLDLKYCKILLRRLENYIDETNLIVYKDFPNISQGKIINEVNDPFSRDIRVIDIVKDLSELFNCIFEFKFKLKVNGYIYDAYLRRNNFRLSRIYGQFEFDIFGNKHVSNFGDLILSQSQVETFKDIIQEWITKDAAQLKISIQEAYIGSSQGDPEIDISKRIWTYYSSPSDFLKDVIKFIKNFEDIDAPLYVKEEYDKINDKLKPYDDTFIARELYASIKFKPKFDEFVRENHIAVAPGSLIISSKNLDDNFIFAREVSEKIVFPVMKSVPGRKDFIEIINEKLN